MSETTELMVMPQGLVDTLVVPEGLEGFYGDEGMNDSLLLIPRIRIVQPTSKEGNPGFFRHSLSGEEYPSIPIVVVRAEEGRVMWNEDVEVDEVRCRSLDGRVPDPRLESPMSPACTEPLLHSKTQHKTVCEYAIWRDKIRPPCDQLIHFLCVDLERGQGFWISFSGMALKPARQYWSTLRNYKKPLWTFATELTLSEERNNKGRFYVPHFYPPRRITNQMATALGPAVLSLMHETVGSSFDDEATTVSREEDAPEGGPAQTQTHGGGRRGGKTRNQSPTENAPEWFPGADDVKSGGPDA